MLQFYASDIDGEKLTRQLNISKRIQSQYAAAFKVDQRSSLGQYNVSTSQLSMGMFSEVVKLYSIPFTLPISNTASAERSFSALRRVKIYLRSTMTRK